MAKRQAASPPVYRWTVDDVRFNPDEHTSALPDGRDVPHVTAILAAVHVSSDFDELRALSAGMSEKIDIAAARGTAVHEDCHALDDGDLILESMDPRVRPFVESWETCRTEMGLTPIAHARERRVYHPLFHYTGILDGVFERQTSSRVKRILLDLKTGDPESAATHLQTAAYESAWVAQFPELPIDERWAVQLTPRFRVPYRVKNYSAQPDAREHFGKFLACLTVYNEQPGRRRRVA